MRTVQKIVAVIGLTSMLTLSVIWGTHSATIQKTVNAVAEDIQKPGHLAVGDIVVYIQKPGH